MAFRKRKTNRRMRKRGGKRRGGTRIPKSRLGLMPSVQNRNYAQITETQRDTDFLSSNTAYLEQFNIGAFPRALLMARLFKYYRCKKIVYDYVPNSNTFQDAASGNSPTIPYFYYNMNRDGASGGDNTLNQFLADGVRPIKFTKKLVIAYKPNLSQLISVVDNGKPTNINTFALGSTPIYDKWISTDGLQAGQAGSWTGSTEPVSNVPIDTTGTLNVLNTIAIPPYYGHNIFIVQDDVGASITVGRKSITVIWEFKEPVLNPRIN